MNANGPASVVGRGAARGAIYLYQALCVTSLRANGRSRPAFRRRLWWNGTARLPTALQPPAALCRGISVAMGLHRPFC